MYRISDTNFGSKYINWYQFKLKYQLSHTATAVIPHPKTMNSDTYFEIYAIMCHSDGVCDEMLAARIPTLSHTKIAMIPNPAMKPDHSYL